MRLRGNFSPGTCTLLLFSFFNESQYALQDLNYFRCGFDSTQDLLGTFETFFNRIQMQLRHLSAGNNDQH